MTDQDRVPRALRVFISYSRHNRDVADQLVIDLEAAGFEVTIDRRDLPYGEEWQAELAGFIHGADTVVWLISSASLASEWCLWELREVDTENKRLLPIVVGEFDISDLPESIARVHLLPAEGLYDPHRHFGDLRDALNSDRGWVKEHTRIADWARGWIASDRSKDQLLRRSALTDAEMWRDRQPDDAPRPSDDVLNLIQASRKHHVKRQRGMVTGSVIAALVALGLSVVAFVQRGIAIEARDAATVAQAEAEAQQLRAERNLLAAVETADGLVFRIAQQFKNRGVPNDIARNILAEARSLQEALFEFEQDDPALQRSRLAAMSEYGATLADYGDPDGALALLMQAVDMARGMVLVTPNDIDLQNSLAIILSQLADVTLRQDVDAADGLYSEVLDIRRGLVALAPNDPEWRFQLSKTLDRVGDIAVQRDVNVALELYEESLALRRRLIELTPENVDVTRALAVSLDRIAGIVEFREPDRAMAHFEEIIALNEQLAQGDPSNRTYLRDRAVVTERLGDLLVLADPQRALGLYQDSLSTSRALLAFEPSDTSLMNDMTVTLNKVAGLMERRNPEEAAALVAEGLALSRRLVAAEPENVRFLRNLTAALTLRADLMAGDAPEQSATLYREGLDIVRSLLRADPDNVDIQRDLIIALDRVADSAVERHESVAAHDEALVLARSLSTADPGNLDLQRVFASALLNAAKVRERQDPRRALSLLTEAREILAQIVQSDPENPLGRRDLSLTLNKIGQLVQQDDPARAVGVFEQAIALRQSLVDARPADVTRRQDLSVSLVLLADLMARYDRPEAVTYYNADLENTLALTRLEPQVVDHALALIVAHYRLGRQGEESEAHYRAALSIIKSLDGNGLPDEWRVWRPEIEDRLGRDLGGRAYDAVLDGAFTSARIMAEEARTLAPNAAWIEINLAHALLFEGDTEAARRLYLTRKGTDAGGRSWNQMVLADIDDLRGRGLDHPEFAAIVAALGE